MLVLVVAVLAGAPGAGAAGSHSLALAPANQVVDGPSADIVGLGGLAVARDGTGALVYLKNLGGVPHVFLSQLIAGSFAPPVQLDQGLSGASSQPVIAATNGAEIVVAFINNGELYGAQQQSALSPFGAPQPLYGGASNPAISMSVFGKAYVAFTASGVGGHDVRSVYYAQGQWGPVTPPLDANPADDAGSGTGRPAVATAGDGTAIVAWGESGHIYTRRVLANFPSVVYEQADPPTFAGWSEVSADLPAVASGGDSSYAAVAFHEVLSSGAVTQSRVILNRLQASVYDGPVAGDGLTTPGGEGATNPRIVVGEYGGGWVTAEGNQTHNTYLTALSSYEVPGVHSQLNSLPQLTSPDAYPAGAGITTTMVTWQQDPGSAGIPEIRIRYAADGVDLDPELVLSSPSLGPTDADLGLFAGGDRNGDTAVTWVQGAGPSTQIIAARLFSVPGSFLPSTLFQYRRTLQPVFSWTPASEIWGTITYTVKVNGVVVGSTESTSLAPAAALAQGRQVWQVTASNEAGGTSTDAPASVFVDTLPPQVRLRFSGRRHVGQPVDLAVTASDRPPGRPASAGSGIAALRINWGDGAQAALTRFASHIYARRGTFRVTVIATDKAGNRTVITRRLKITLAPAPRRPKAPGKKAKPRSGKRG